MTPLPGDDAPLFHGGDLGAARRLFPGATEPFIDLSTGINPHPYPVPRIPSALFASLPDPGAAETLAQVAARAYGAPSRAHVVAAPGSQILLPLVAALAPPGRAVIITPGYSEHSRAASLAGHTVTAIGDIDQCGDATLVVVGNPNNPDGRIFPQSDLVALAKTLRRRNGVLVADEAFMDVGPSDQSLAGDVACGNIVVLRSFGKFFGLAGLRLGFALASPPLAARLRAHLGPWAVSAPALTIGTRGLADAVWIERTRRRLDKATRRLDGILSGAALTIVGGTSLFRLVRTPPAGALFAHLGRAGIFVRAFPEHPDWLRFGLPANEDAWRRLKKALVAFW
jgi:cobalamin biosynthetic protein CobC